MLTERQLSLIQAVIERYVETSEPVGSVEIVKNYNLRCSAATIRNEMAKLIDLGFLEMLHTSSGRVPTRMAYRLYLNDLMEEEELPVLQEVAMKQRLWPNRYSFEKLLREAVVSLSENTKLLAVATTDDRYVTHSGEVYILEHREFWDIDAAKTVFLLADSFDILNKVFTEIPNPENNMTCVLEEEIGIKNLESTALIYAPFKGQNKSGHVAVIGPSRIDYATVIPALKYTQKLIEELSGNW
jgi:transcriptional regulator of heat shock response